MLEGSDTPESSNQHNVIQEHLKREDKLSSELNEVKSKSRKAVTALRAQLADAQNKHTRELDHLKNELTGTQEKLDRQEQQRSSVEEELSALKAEREALQEEIQHSALGQRNAEATAQQLREELEALAQGRDGTSQEPPGRDVANKSAQWTEQSGQLTPQSVGDFPLHISMQSIPAPLIMDEVDLLDFNASPSPLHTSPLNASPRQSSLQYSPRIPYPTSLVGSVSGMGAPPGTPPHAHAIPQHSFSMLSALSHLPTSRPSPPTTAQSPLTFEHPVLVEWGKAYECVLQFREHLVGMLLDQPGLEALGRGGGGGGGGGGRGRGRERERERERKGYHGRYVSR